MTAGERAEELVVQVVAVGDDDQRRVLHRRVEDDAAGVERHRQALARALGVPDDADAPVARLGVALPLHEVRALFFPHHQGSSAGTQARRVSARATFTAWYW